MRQECTLIIIMIWYSKNWNFCPFLTCAGAKLHFMCVLTLKSVFCFIYEERRFPSAVRHSRWLLLITKEGEVKGEK